MKRCAFPTLALAIIAPVTFARVGDMAADYQNRYGDPIAESFDKAGHGIRLYRSAEFIEIRVTFAGDKSLLEKYTVADGVDKEALFARIRTEKGVDDSEYSYVDGEGKLQIGSEESANELKFVRGDGALRSYSGRLEVKKKDNRDYAVLYDNDAVLEIPLASLATEAPKFRSGLECKITVLNRVPDDLWAPMAWVGKREHLDDEDMLDDAHDELQTLVSVENDVSRIYDRSFCSVHQTPMALQNAKVAFGMLMFSPASRYCQERFPHYRDFAIGGCVMSEGDENKTIQLYVCPRCVAACNEYKAAHPERDRD